MTESQIFTWILLSVPDKPGTLQDIIAMADGINKAVPTHHELRTSLGWLIARGLVRSDGRRYCLTGSSSQLLTRLRGDRDLVAAELETLRGEPAAPANITLAEMTGAYDAYRKAFLKSYKESERSATDA